ncbi:MAG: hypothetical protein HJJLKODD_00222 [Phycisphaerae bacterium]|nr:hypothetical protein [Phycisphaerae bacterium]
MWSTRIIVFCGWGLIAAGPQPGLNPPQETQPTSNEVGLATWVEELAHPEYAVRQQAQEQLRALPIAALPHLHDIYLQLSDLEVRLQLASIAEDIACREVVMQSGGFIGISWQPVDAVEDSRVPRDQFGVIVQRVLPGSAAERAGLAIGDLLLSMDGEKLMLDPKEPRDFARQIGSVPPGKRIKFGVMRGHRYFTVRLIVGHRPWTYIRSNPQLSPEAQQQVDHAEELLREWQTESQPSSY